MLNCVSLAGHDKERRSRPCTLRQGALVPPITAESASSGELTNVVACISAAVIEALVTTQGSSSAVEDCRHMYT